MNWAVGISKVELKNEYVKWGRWMCSGTERRLMQVNCIFSSQNVPNRLQGKDITSFHLLAPTGALIVIVCYYWSGMQLLQI